MKNLMMCLVVVMVGLVSCDKDDEKQATPAGIEGTWQYTKEGGIVDGVEMLEDFPHAAGCTKDYLRILSNGTYEDHNFFGTECFENTFSGTWTRSGSIFTYLEAGETSPVVVEILSLTDTTLKTKEIFEGETLVTIYTEI